MNFLTSFHRQKKKPEGHYSSFARPLPRNRPIVEKRTDADMGLPALQTVSFPVNNFKVILRIFRWYYGFLLFLSGRIVDMFRGKDSQERQGERLRLVFEKLGGTFLKIGQQLSVRVDILPVKYCNELAKMLDRIQPFEFEYALKVIRRTTGREPEDIFQAIDPKPIGSASLACVFKAILKSGEQVAVKIRREAIGEQFMTDCKALEWMIGLSETLAFARPGAAITIVKDLRQILLQELDFRNEMRYTDVFRRQIKKHKQNYMMAPRVYPELSGEEMLVLEFVDAIPLTEVLSAVEQKDEKALGILREKKISPKRLSQRLTKFMNYGNIECILYHGDPHPANIMVKPKNKLVIIDFGACGYSRKNNREMLQKVGYYKSIDDVEGIVDASLQMMEPLPHFDMDSVKERMRDMFWELHLAFKTRHYQWYERTNMPIFLGMMAISQEFNVPMNPNGLRLMRATNMIQTVIGRLHSIDIYKEINKFQYDQGDIARRRNRKQEKRIMKGKRLQKILHLEIERNARLEKQIQFQKQSMANDPPARYSLMVEKGAYFSSLFLRFALNTGILTALWTLGAGQVASFGGGTPDYDTIFSGLLTNKGYLLAFGALLFVTIRKALYRLDDMNVYKK